MSDGQITRAITNAKQDPGFGATSINLDLGGYKRAHFSPEQQKTIEAILDSKGLLISLPPHNYEPIFKLRSHFIGTRLDLSEKVVHRLFQKTCDKYERFLKTFKVNSNGFGEFAPQIIMHQMMEYYEVLLSELEPPAPDLISEANLIERINSYFRTTLTESEFTLALEQLDEQRLIEVNQIKRHIPEGLGKAKLYFNKELSVQIVAAMQDIELLPDQPIDRFDNPPKLEDFPVSGPTQPKNTL